MWSLCQFPWGPYALCAQFQATYVTSLDVELGGDTRSWPVSWLPHTSGCQGARPRSRGE